MDPEGVERIIESVCGDLFKVRVSVLQASQPGVLQLFLSPSIHQGIRPIAQRIPSL
jgi:hypothetical protein